MREVLDDAARDRLAHNVIGHVSKGVREPVLSRVFEYWRAIDADLGKKIEEGCGPISTATAAEACCLCVPTGMIDFMSIDVVYTAESTASGGAATVT